MKHKYQAGQKIGKWTLMFYRPANGKSGWISKCECGREKLVRTSNLISGSLSCGCARKNRLRHGHAGTKIPKTAEYRAWQSMKRRCFDINDKGYRNYGGRGITVCSRWSEDFVNFLTDMGTKPSSNYSLDRINNDGNYEPSNCRWTTRSEQNSNTRKHCAIENYSDEELQNEIQRRIPEYGISISC